MERGRSYSPGKRKDPIRIPCATCYVKSSLPNWEGSNKIFAGLKKEVCEEGVRGGTLLREKKGSVKKKSDPSRNQGLIFAQSNAWHAGQPTMGGLGGVDSGGKGSLTEGFGKAVIRRRGKALLRTWR